VYAPWQSWDVRDHFATRACQPCVPSLERGECLGSFSRVAVPVEPSTLMLSGARCTGEATVALRLPFPSIDHTTEQSLMNATQRNQETHSKLQSKQRDQ
jgi:hypothetical protein